MGAGYVVYFKMVTFFGIIITLFVLINFIKIISNIRGTQCSGGIYAFQYQPCVKDWITVHSVANYGIQKEDGTEKGWVLVYWIAYSMALSVCKLYIKSTNKEVDKLNDTPSDWTMMVSGMPVVESEESIRQNFEAFGHINMRCDVKKVNRAYKLDEFLKKEASMNQVRNELKKLKDEELPHAVNNRLEKEKNAQSTKEEGGESQKKNKNGQGNNL